ncbi:hypothetical protein BHU61_09915 [Macrococcus epidermidis]|uniref:Uncharacterized protein n=1 Tax=Macrococcus epidermidis TaxID=1902580 RepID=A0A327ZQF9_9STAP|nr:hypothetical protein BHU61_09915 [Macrococcus epidermidis]
MILIHIKKLTKIIFSEFFK